MTAWDMFYAKVRDATYNDGVSNLWYRGHTTGRWKLAPGLGRVSPGAYKGFDQPKPRALEENLYSDFVQAGGELIPRTSDSWDVLFLMQHHGLPTRLLDWTESFAIALFFALAGVRERPCIWILNPYLVNKHGLNSEEILDTPDLEHSYNDYFLRRTIPFPAAVLALRPRRHVRRIGQQLSAFTLHRDLGRTLDKLYPDAVTKLAIPANAIPEAWEFLDLTGISEYTLFPDLDGLARHMKRDYGL
jgi:hypothetical protein